MKQDYSVKDILTAVDDILNVKSTQESKKKITNEIPVKDILSAVDNILKVKSIQAPAKEIINEIYQKNDNAKKIAKNPEYKKEDEIVQCHAISGFNFKFKKREVFEGFLFCSCSQEL